MLTYEIKHFIKQDAKSKYPLECCGLLVDISGYIYAVPCLNVSKTPEKSFIISNEEIKKYGLDNIRGFYHSHKDNPDFSLADIAFSEKLNLKCVLYCCDSDIFKIYEPNGMEIPYVGRPFFIGTLDCFNLFKDYYRRELNIVFNDTIEHPERLNYSYWSTDECFEKYGYCKILEDYFLSHGFNKVNDLKQHDIIEIKMPHIKFPTHIGIYLGQQKLLHHLHEFSAIESYSSKYKRLTTNIYRHNSLM